MRIAQTPQTRHRPSSAKRFRCSGYFLLIGMALLIAYPAPSNAVSATNAGTPGLEEIVVTATKRAQSLQEVPIAVSAFSAETIEDGRLQSLADIALRTPNFLVGQQGPTAPELTIRGIGSTDRESGSDRSVVVFVDEVYIGRTGASTFDLFDLERIEVLRGPQGTLFGRNVVGGAVNLITAKPHDEFDAKAQITAGGLDLLEFKAMVNGPLGDTLAGRLSASAKSRNGIYTSRTFRNANSNGGDSVSVRGQLKFTPSDVASLLFSLDYAEDEVNGVANKLTQGAVSDSDFLTGALGPFGPFVPDADPYTTSNNVFGHVNREHVALTGRLDWGTRVGEATLIPAYRSVRFDEVRDIAGIGFTDLGGDGIQPMWRNAQDRGFESTAINDEAYDAFSLEARLASSAEWARPLDWVLGLYYLDEKINRDQIRARQANIAYSRPLFDQLNNASSVAVFGELTYRFIPRAAVTLGGRYTRDEKDFDMVVRNTLSAAEIDEIAGRLNRAPSLNPAVEVYRASAAEEWSEFTPKATLSFDLNDDAMLFATLSEGFKSGGFVGLAATAAAATRSFAPETARNIEVGLKSTLLDGRLQLNASYYSLDFKDMQLRDRILLIPGDVTSAVVTVVNAGEAAIDGVELDFVALLGQGLTLSGSLATLDSEVKAVNEGSTLSVGSRLPRGPEVTWNLAAEWECFLPRGTLRLLMDYRHTGDHYFDLNEQPAGREDGYGLLGARMVFAAPSWEAALWGKNLTDKLHRTHVQSIRAGRAGLSQIGEPRTWGLTFTKWFD